MRAYDDEAMEETRVAQTRIWSGLILNDNYKIGALLNQGAIAEVYDGTEISSGERVAIKILLPQLAADLNIRAMFADEARTLSRLSHPGLLKYRCCAEDPKSSLLYIVTECVGPILSSRLWGQKYPRRDIFDFAKRLALALSAAHQSGLLHREISPDNIVLMQGRLTQPKLINFVFIKNPLASTKAPFNQQTGNAYCAPEQLWFGGPRQAIGPWTDIYSLALVVLAVAGGVCAHGDEMLLQAAITDLSPLPQRLRPLFARMLEPDPVQRIRSVDQIIEELDRLELASPAFEDEERRPWALWAAANLSRLAKTPLAASLAAVTALKNNVEALRLLTIPRLTPTRSIAGLVAIALLVAAVSWLFQSSLPATEAGARIAQLEKVRKPDSLLKAKPELADNAQASAPAAPTALTEEPAKTTPTNRTLVDNDESSLPDGKVYGADNRNSRLTLRIHRKTKLAVMGPKNKVLLLRKLEPGDSYRAPNLPVLTVTTADAGAVEVVFNGKSSGFVGKDGEAAEHIPLKR